MKSPRNRSYGCSRPGSRGSIGCTSTGKSGKRTADKCASRRTTRGQRPCQADFLSEFVNRQRKILPIDRACNRPNPAAAAAENQAARHRRAGLQYKSAEQQASRVCVSLEGNFPITRQRVTRQRSRLVATAFEGCRNQTQQHQNDQPSQDSALKKTNSYPTRSTCNGSPPMALAATGSGSKRPSRNPGIHSPVAAANSRSHKLH